MSGQREWQPGDVAAIPFARGEVRAIYGADGWLVCDTPQVSGSRSFGGVRPLVVIDPEDREQAAQLLAAYSTEVQASYRGEDEPDDWRTDRMQAALREFANPTPPRPAEPMGLGAVVEDAKGDYWVYAGRRTALSDTRVWVHANLKRVYDEIAAVSVLSEGVQP